MKSVALLVSLLLAAQFAYIAYFVLRRRFRNRRNTDALLFMLANEYPSLEIGEDFQLSGHWQGLPIEINIIKRTARKLAVIEMESTHAQDSRMIMTPQFELFEADKHDDPLLHYFSLFQYPQDLVDTLFEENPSLRKSLIDTWFKIDPPYPFDCYHKLDDQKQTLRLSVESGVAGIKAALDMMALLEASVKSRAAVSV